MASAPSNLVEASVTSAPSSLVEARQEYTIHDWELALPRMQAIFDLAAVQPGAHHYDWTRADNRVLWRSTFEDADSMLGHHDATTAGSVMDELLEEGVAEQGRFAVTGPLQELHKIKDRMGRLDGEYFESQDGFQTGFISQTGTDQTGIATAEGTLCSSCPSFKVQDWTAAAPLVRQFIDRTGLETGCTYFGWSSRGEDLQWHGNYKDGTALRDHFNNVSDLILALDEGPARMMKLELHGPAVELDKARDATAHFRDVLRYESDHRVQRLVQRFEHLKQS